MNAAAKIRTAMIFIPGFLSSFFWRLRSFMLRRRPRGLRIQVGSA